MFHQVRTEATRIFGHRGFTTTAREWLSKPPPGVKRIAACKLTILEPEANAFRSLALLANLSEETRWPRILDSGWDELNGAEPVPA